MNFIEYFNSKKGVGIMSTADSRGKVDSAVHARSHFMDDGSLAWIMRDRLTQIEGIRKTSKSIQLGLAIPK